MTETTFAPPVKGTVWQHPVHTDWKGDPKLLTVTSFVKNGKGGKAYVRSVDELGTVYRSSPEAFEARAIIVSVPAVVETAAEPTMSDAQRQALWDKAHAAGMANAERTRPTPMVVVERANPFDDTSPIVREYEPVYDGVCGFAWVTVRPGNGMFARWMRRAKGTHKAYEGGEQHWIGAFNQSYELKYAYARGFADTLAEAGIKAYAGGRLD